MIYGYLRVSSDDQQTSNQKSLIESRGFNIDKWIIDEATSGMVRWKDRKLRTAIRKSVQGDIIIVAELSRIGRSLKDVLDAIDICKKKNVSIICIREGFEIKDDNPITKLLISIIGSLAEMERDLISQRTKDALARKKSEGIILGRKKGSITDKNKLKGFVKRHKIIDMKNQGMSFTSIAKKLRLHRSTVSRYYNTYLQVGEN